MSGAFTNRLPTMSLALAPTFVVGKIEQLLTLASGWQRDRHVLAPRVMRSSSSWSNVSGIPPSIPAIEASRASFEG